MDALLAEERAAEQHVATLLRDRSRAITDMLSAMSHYRKAAEACIFADFEAAGPHEDRLWVKHTEGRKYFHRALSTLRRAANQEDLVVAKRQCVKLFLYFLKDSHRFYQNYIQTLRAAFPAVPELDLVVRGLKIADSDESSQQLISSHLRDQVLASCHRALVYLGDISRYRAAEKLDEKPDYARAIGYYGLACSFRPISGSGHHQQAVIFLEQRKHLSAVYELYRAVVADEPHPLAISNLAIEFGKIKEAKDKGELLKPGHPKDPDTHKNALVGWFVYLHSECYKGEIFREYEALEREVVAQLANLLTHDERDLNSLLKRIVLVNMAAQFTASENFKNDPSKEHQQSFYYLFRFNIRIFTTLLRTFQDGMTQTSAMAVDDLTLASKLTPTAYRLLPVLRLYSTWLMPMVVLIDGLSGDDFIKPAVDDFWPTYTHAMDLVSQTFPIWEFDDQPQVTYLLDEDGETLAFKPLIDEKTISIWFDRQGAQKPYRYDVNVECVAVEDEMLARVQGLLNDAVSLANDDDNAPLRLHGTRFLYGDEEAPVLPITYHQQPKPITNGKAQPSHAAPKPLTYAAAVSAPATTMPRYEPAGPPGLPNGASTSSDQAQDEKLTRMVDNLLDDDDDHPITPPQQHVSHPAVVGDMPHNTLRDSAQEMGQIGNYAFPPKPYTRPVGAVSPPGIHTPKSPANANLSSERLQSVSNIWTNSPLLSASPQFPPGLPTGTLTSPAHATVGGHSRVNSASSVRSNVSQNVGDSWSSLDSSAQLPGLPTIGHKHTSFHPNLGTPTLFGTSGRPWSSWANGAQPQRESYNMMSPPNGQGG